MFALGWLTVAWEWLERTLGALGLSLINVTAKQSMVTTEKSMVTTKKSLVSTK